VLQNNHILGESETGFELGFSLAKQALYHLSHIFSPFFSVYFGNGVLINYLPRLVLNCNTPNLSLPSSWSYRIELLALGEQSNIKDELSELVLVFWNGFCDLIRLKCINKHVSSGQ
jgi:hypothetical protein